MSDQPRETVDTDRMLLDFVGGRDVECPLCGYNLRDLTTTACPECEHRLELRVGVQRLHVMLFVLAIGPGIFSGLCAAFLTFMMVSNFISNSGRLVGFPWPMIAADVFGWLSGVLTIGLIVRRRRFLAAPPPKQRGLAAVIWTVHGMAFLLLMILLLF